MHKVFGIGLIKTGTTTLARCFGILGLGTHVASRGDLLAKYREGALDEIFAVSDDAETFEDWPWPLMYRELFYRYGDTARYILTTRSSAEVWLESLKRHSMRTPVDSHCRLLAFGYNYPHGLEAYHLRFYETHNRQVREFFALQNCQHLLLEVSFDSGHGWPELCAFLNRPVPDVPFPHENLGTVPIPEGRQRENAIRIREQLSLLRKS